MVLAVFLPSLRHEFICYDDNGYVTQSSWVKDGLTWANVVHAFRTTEIAYWHPLTWMSHLVDVELFGRQSWGHHLTSALLHAANALLVFVVLRKLTGALWRSWLVAALFGLHPLHVESVAWVAERKDVLSTFFWLLALWSYAQWVGQKTVHCSRTFLFYGLSLLLFAAGLMSKPMVVTLPFVLLLLDYWPLNRWGRQAAGPGAASPGRLFMEKVPFLALSVADSILTVGAQADLGTLQTTVQFPFPARLANALVSYLGYLEKCFLPAKLAVFYPYPENQPVGPVLVAGALLAGLSLAAAVWHRSRPYLLVGWLWYLGTLVPVIGLVQVGSQAMADRYSYVPLIGVFVILTWGVADVTRGWARRSFLLGPAAAAALGVLTVLTNRQLGYWQDCPTLFRHALAVTGDNWCAHFCLGYHYTQPPARLPEAIAEYREAARLAPSFLGAHHSLAAVLARTPDGLAEAASEYQIVLRLSPRHVPAHIGRGQALARMPGRFGDAVAEFEAAVRFAPENLDAHINLAYALAQLPDRLPEAIVEYRATLKLAPDSAEAHYSLGTMLVRAPGGLAEAVSEYEAALRINPGYAPAHSALGKALVRIPGRLDAAAAEFKTTVRLTPGDPAAHLDLGRVLARMPGRASEAIAEYEAAISIRPDYGEAHFYFGEFLSTYPDRLPEAIAHLETALNINPDLEPARAMLVRLHTGALR